ncbi:Os09g0572550 [Oryza sativa Japonica Group]|uniref:Os09g0572550 protein n=1 Tax=Oryza sativa subsp. japonica TaxID=39947 RepID=A0A0P0XRK5_ORYSJ|nr:hypothetical protein EE612_049624 [Oryza sativa]BAT09542.1 Os09g0572550 [Oryza sativa Japonica Group]
MTGGRAASCRCSRPRAAPCAMRIRVVQSRAAAPGGRSSRWSSREPRAMYSYTRMRWSPSVQYPSSVTRFGCSASRLSISTSTRNSRFPCIPFRSSCFTAASVTVPLMLSLPRYTGPNPPSPSSDSALNPPVASDSSPYVNARAVTFPLPIFRISSATRLCRFTRLLLLSLLLPPRLRSDAKFFFLLLLLLLLQPLEEVEGGAPSPSPSPSPPLSSDWKQQKMPIIFMVCWALHQRQQERILEPEG